MYRENTDFQKDTKRNGTKRNEFLPLPSSILRYSIRRLIEFVKKKKGKHQIKISPRSNIRARFVLLIDSNIHITRHSRISNIEKRKKRTAKNRKEQLDKVRKKREDQEPRSFGEIGGKKSLVAGRRNEGGRGQSTVINNEEERWFRPTSQSHRAKIRARRERRTIYSVQAASWRFLAGCPPPSIDYAIVVPGHPLSHPRYRGPTRDQTRQIFVVSEGQLLFCE